MMGPLFIYGATGYTGSLIAQAAQRANLPIILGGRDEAKLRSLATTLGVSCHVMTVDDPRLIDRALAGSAAVLNAAGPFRATAPAIIQACLRNGVHYLDITGEVDVMAAASESDGSARRQGVMVMPAVGFDVVPSDSLALHVARRAVSPRELFLAISGLELLTRGSAKTMVEHAGEPLWVRRRGVLQRAPVRGQMRAFDFGRGPVPSLATSWGDVVSAYFTTGVPDITVYFEATPAVWSHDMLAQFVEWTGPLAPWREVFAATSRWVPEGPSAAERSRRGAIVVAEVTDHDGRLLRSRMRTPEAYSMTTSTAVAIASRVLSGDFQPGFQTPARAYGADFVLSIDGVEREDL